MRKAVVILSGGQDSVTTLLKAHHDADVEVVAGLHFEYGQRHAVEAKFADKACGYVDVPFRFSTVSCYNNAPRMSALIDLDTPIGDAHHLNPDLPASFLPGRNLLFLTIGAAYAMALGATEVWTGVCQTDYSGYPDCRESTMRMLEATIRVGMGFPGFNIVTPLMYLTKAETFELAASLGELDYILEDTHTCYEGDRNVRHPWGYGCGRCSACAIRRKGWLEMEANIAAIAGK